MFNNEQVHIVSRLELTDITETDNEYYLYFTCGTAYIQRKHKYDPSDPPLTSREKAMLALIEAVES